MNKKALYESIMLNVAKEVKKSLNESVYSEDPKEAITEFIDMYFEDSITDFAINYCNAWDDGEVNVDLRDVPDLAAEILKEKLEQAILDEWEENH